MATLFVIGLLGCLFSQFDAEGARLARRTTELTAALVIALALGYTTLFTLSPTPLKMPHLCMAHILWLVLLRWSLSAAGPAAEAT